MVPGIDGVGTLEDGSRVYFTFARKPWGSMCERPYVRVRGACLCRMGWTTDSLRRFQTRECRRGFR
jgi:hypothetical protein